MPSGRILPVRKVVLYIICSVSALSCRGPVPVTDQESLSFIKADTVYYSNGNWLTGDQLFQVVPASKTVGTEHLLAGIFAVTTLFAIIVILVRRFYHKKMLYREAAESQRVIELVKDRVAIVNKLAQAHELSQKQSRAESYQDKLDALQALIDGYHSYLEQLRTDQSFIKDIEQALDAGEGNVMQKARRLLGDAVSEEDYCILSLYIAGMKTSSISFVTRLAPGTLRTKKSRLKARLEKLPDTRDKNFVLKALNQLL